ncbi:MAG: ATP-binding protein [Candidatus Nephthysia bennettiae]|nr:MAG: ATP-binding protein [Candidatus Dormibacteraeota bacterium]
MRHVIAVGSGKGGVGKSTVSLNLALALAQRGLDVGLLDADLYGPNIPIMVGLTRQRWTEYWTLARPGRRRERYAPVVRNGLKIVSAGFILGEDQPLAVDAMTATTMVRQLLHDVDWGEPDYLIVDLPPGTGDIHQALLKIIPVTGALIVVTPQYVAHLDARKAVRLYQRHHVPVLGWVENMGPMACPHCGEPVAVFPEVPPARSIRQLGIEPIGSIPFDPALGAAGDSGQALVVDGGDSAPARAFRALAESLVRTLG